MPQIFFKGGFLLNKFKYILSIFIFLFISILFITNVNAYSEEVDIKKNQPFTAIEGEEITHSQLAKIITYGGISNNTNNFKITKINNLSISTYPNAKLDTKINKSKLENGSTTYIHNLSVEYINPTNNETVTTNIPFVIVENKFPILSVPHIYISSSQYDTFKKDNLKLKQTFEFYLLDSIIINDVDGSTFYKEPKTESTATTCSDLFSYDVNIYAMNGNTSVDIENYTKGTTTQFCITVNDLKKSVTIPCYVTFLLDDNVKEETYDTFTRSISSKYYPYFRKDIQFNDGFYFAIKKDNAFYFLNNDNKILRDEDGNPFPVDACLTSMIIPFDNDGKIDEGEVCKVMPVSKWVKNGNCMALLTSCLTYTEGDPSEKKYVSSWTFPSEEIEIVKNSFSTSSKLDPNFYLNYSTNGYCELGNKDINSTGKIISETPLMEEVIDKNGNKTLVDTGLTWYISDETLYIEAKEIASEDYSYKIPDYPISTTLSQMYHDDVKYDKNGIFILKSGSSFYDLSSYFTLSGEHDRSNVPPWYSLAQAGAFNKVVFDDKITSIGAYAFYNCTNITKPITIPDNCTHIKEAAFLNCTNLSGGLETLSVYEIGDFAFANCKELTGKLTFGVSALSKIGVGAFCNSGISKSLAFPSTVYSIGDFAFMNCVNLDGTLLLNATLKELGQFAFAGCLNLDGRLTIPNTLTEIKPFTFAGCSGFNEDLNFSESNIETIGEYAFYGCTNLTSVANVNDTYVLRLPKSLKTIHTGAFKNCQNLKTILVLNENLTYIGPEAFAGCVNIITLDNSALVTTDKTTKLPVEKDIYIAPTAFFTKNYIATNIVSKFIGTDNTKKTEFAEYNFLGDNRMITND